MKWMDSLFVLFFLGGGFVMRVLGRWFRLDLKG